MLPIAAVLGRTKICMQIFLRPNPSQGKVPASKNS